MPASLGHVLLLAGSGTGDTVCTGQTDCKRCTVSGAQVLLVVHSSLLVVHSSVLVVHSSLLVVHSSLLVDRSSL